MANNLSFFAIHADDMDRGRRFYEQVFGWRFEPWGPPGFYLIQGAGVPGALQERREKLTGTGFRAFECTIGVDSIDEIEPKIVPAGGKIDMKRMRLETVGLLLYMLDTEGNRVGVMQYDHAQSSSP